jgi:hypothetical protein
LNPFLLFDLIPLFVLTLIDCVNRMGNAMCRGLSWNHSAGSEPLRIRMGLGSHRLLDSLEPDRTCSCAFTSHLAPTVRNRSRPDLRNFGLKTNFRICNFSESAGKRSFSYARSPLADWHRHCLNRCGIDPGAIWSAVLQDKIASEIHRIRSSGIMKKPTNLSILPGLLAIGLNHRISARSSQAHSRKETR